MSHATSLRAKYRARQLELLALEERLTPAYDISLIDINTINGQTAGSSSPEWITPLGNIVIFSADDGKNGRELWRSDGTTAGTFMIKDIYVGTTGSKPLDLTAANNLVYFTADNGNDGRELWKTDGTAAGTMMVKDISPGSAFSSNPIYTDYLSSSDPQPWLTNVNGTVFFCANDGTNGIELWKTDGTPDGTVMVKDIATGTYWGGGNSFPNSFCNVNGTLFFSAQSQNTGMELWKSDGTPNGTALVRDLEPGSSPSYPHQLYAFQNKVYFSCSVGSYAKSLMASDGSLLGTTKIKDFVTGYGSLNLNGFGTANNTLLFDAYDDSFGTELWKTDGTPSGTSLVKDLAQGSGSGIDFILYPHSIFNSPIDNSVSKPNIQTVGSRLYFSSPSIFDLTNSSRSVNIYYSDGTGIGTQTASNKTRSSSNPNGFDVPFFGPVINQSLLYQIRSGSSSPSGSIYSLNTVDNTETLIGPAGFFSAFTTRMQGAGGKAFFGATEGSVGTELWVVREVNAPPVISTGLAGRTSSAGSPVSFSVASSFSDPNNDTLSFTATGLPTGLSISTAGLISGTIASTAATGSPYTTRVTANDGNGGTVTASFTWTVLPPNRNPVAGTLSARTSGISDIVNLSLASSFSDPDNDPLSYSATNLPPGLAMSATGLVSGTVLSSASTSTPYAVTVTVADGRGGTATGSFSWTINAANRPPVASNLADRSDSTGNRVSFAAASAFSDPDFDSLSFTATGLPDGLAVSASGIVTGTIASTASASSPYTTRITASDGRGGTVTASFIWTVTAGASIPRNAAFDLIGLSDMRANPATAGIDGTGIGVAVIDTGIDYAHALFQSGGNTAYYTAEDISGGLVPVGRDFTGDAQEGSFNPGDPRNRYSSSRFNSPSVNQRNATFAASGGGVDNQPEDTNGHGTHVAGIIGARNPDIGVATGSKLIGLKVLGTDGLGSNENVLAALEWVRDNAAYYNIKVVNMSLGYGFFSSLGEGDPFASTIADLEAQGITIVSAAGNLYGLTPTERNSATPGIASTLTVGAVWKDGTVNQAYWPEGDTYDYTTGAGRLTSFSQRPADIVDNGIFAPGALMLSAIPNNGVDPTRGNDLTAELAGTSQAAPVVSGVVALMQDAAYRAGGRYLSPAEIRQILFQTATTVNDGDNEDDGFAQDPSTLQYTLDNNTHADYRMINANNAVTAVRQLFDTPSQPDDPNGVITSPVELSPDYTRSQIADINPSLDAGNPLRYTPVVADFHGEIGKDGDTTVGDKDVDLYAFTVDLAGALTIKTSRASDTTPVVNTQLRLFDSSGNEITANVDNRDDNDPSTDLNGLFDPFSTLKVRLEPGRYFVGVSGQGNGSYNTKTELSGTAGSTVLGVKATGPYHLTMDYLTQDPNGLLPGALETYLQANGATVQRGFLGGDYLSSSSDIAFPRPDQLDPAYGGTVVDSGALGIDGRPSHTISTKVADVDLFIMTAPENGFISFDIDSLDYTTSNNDPGMAADTFVRAWLVNADGTLTELGSNDNGYNPDERLLAATGALAGDDSSQSTSFDAFLKVPVSAGDRILFGVSDHLNQGYDPLNFSGRQPSANSHVGLFDAFATFTSNDLNGRIGADIYNLDPVGTGAAIGLLPTTSQTFNIGLDDQSATGGSAQTVIGPKDVDFFAYTAPANGTLFVDADSLEANLPDAVGTVITIFEIAIDAGGFRTLNVVGTSADASGVPTGIDPKLGVAVTANRQYYVAVSGAGNTSFNPFRQASGTAALGTGSYKLESQFVVQNTVVADPPVTVFRPANRTRFASARLGYDATGTKVSGNDLDTFIYTPTASGTVSISVLPGAESAAAPSFRVFSQTGTGPYTPLNSTVSKPGTVTLTVAQGTKYAIVTSGSRAAITTNGTSFQSTGTTRGTTGAYSVSIDDSKLTKAPVVAGPASRAFTVSSSSTLTGFNITDSDAGSTVSTLTASVDRGTLTGGGKTGASITLTGTLAQLNTSLAALAFKSANLNATPAKLTLTAKDASGNSASLTSTLAPTENLITTITDPELAGKKSVLVVGTSGADSVTVTGSGSTYRVVLNGRAVSLTGVTGRVLAFGLAGNDTIDMPVAIATVSYGGDGDDIIRAGSAADRIFGENGADLLAGGLGADLLNGGADNDLLFDGSVAPKTASLSLASTLALWKTFTNPTDANYTTIYNRLTVTSDKNSRDTIQGTTGLDLFFASATDILDKIASERTRFA